MRRRTVIAGLAALWLAALVASWSVMSRAAPPEPGPGQRTAEVPRIRLVGGEPREQTGGDDGSRPVRIAYREFGDPAGPAVLLLHGSPGSSNDFDAVEPHLAPSFRWLAPDLPGFGNSERWVPDYSARAHAAYCLALLEALRVDRVHVVGYSMGSAVGLELYELAPARVRSLTMLSALGVIELELFGDATLNHALHELQLAALRALRWLVPHFGLLDDFALDVAYARNFTDTDQRRLRPLLETFEPPVLVLHGEDDFLIPVAAAREHARIVPQAELVVATRDSVPEIASDARYGPGHFMLWRAPKYLAAATSDFLARVEAGTARRRADAEPARAAAAREPFAAHGIPPFQGPALFAIVLLLALATLVSEDLACIAAGLLVADGRLGFVPASAACFGGIFVGDVGLYWTGRLLGRAALARRPLSWLISAESVERASRWFSKRGVAVIFLSRLTPGLRLPTYLAAGILRTRFTTFALFFAIAALLWVPGLVAVAAWLGREAADAIGGFGRENLGWIVLLVVGLIEVYHTLPLVFTHRGRRLLRGRWTRRTHWEFWPTWLTYIPVLAHIAWLGIKHRGLSKVTAANPMIEGGGIVGESKAEILRAFGDAPEVPPWRLVPARLEPEQRVALARELIASLAADRPDAVWPVIVKPDAGQRGSGVRAVPDLASLDAAMLEAEHDTLVQARVDGVEYGVFYVRHPAEPVGRIFAVTIKELPAVTGDGERTLEDLVLDDPRACALHGVYARENVQRFYEVIPAGERVELVRVGTHARGAIFRDGRHLATPELTAAVDRLARLPAGFYFGRFDVRVPSEAHFVRGEALSVIELNGVTSEATNVYDAKMGLVEAYRFLFAQWREAFAIGAYNAARGTPTRGLYAVLCDWRAYRRAQRGHHNAPSPPVITVADSSQPDPDRFSKLD